MKTSRLTYALIAVGVVAVAVALAKAHVELNLENLTGYGLAIGLITLVASEYKVGEKHVSRR